MGRPFGKTSVPVPLGTTVCLHTPGICLRAHPLLSLAVSGRGSPVARFPCVRFRFPHSLRRFLPSWRLLYFPRCRSVPACFVVYWFVCLYVDPAREASLALFHFRLSPLHSRLPPKGSPFASCWRFPTGAHRPRRLPCASCPRMDCERGLPFLLLALPASASGRTLCTMLVVPGWGSPARLAPLCKSPS